MRRAAIVIGAGCAMSCGVALAANWHNYGGNARRNGLSPEIGPAAADPLWSDPTFSLITWHPFIEDGIVYTVRESGFPGAGAGNANDEIVALDLDTGEEVWGKSLPYAGNPSNEWIAWIGGVHGGRLYASRSDNSKNIPIRCLDAKTGDQLWMSQASTRAWAHDGMVFAEDGDPIVGDFDSVLRINAEDGATVYNVPRSCPVSGNCGVARGTGCFFIVGAAPGGNIAVKHDLETGAVLYQSPVMPGFTAQNSAFVGNDGTLYFARSQNNASVDFLYAFADTGSSLEQKWAAPIRWTTSHEHGIGPDGSIYTLSRDNEIIRLDPDTGEVIAASDPLAILGADNVSPKTVVDVQGKVYISNGWASTPATNGRIWCFSADLRTLLFELQLDRPNAGGPVLADGGTLVVADRNAVYAYRSVIAPPLCPEDLNGDLVINSTDLNILLTGFGNPAPPAQGDINGDGVVNSQDLNALLTVFGQGCGG